MNTQLTRTEDLKTLAAKPEYANRIKEVLRDRAPQFVSSLLQVGNRLPDCDPRTILTAAMTAAALDLPIDPNLGQAYIVPYKGKAQFQIGYKGFVQLALRTGQYKHLNASSLFDGELQKYDRIKGEVVIDEAQKKSAKITGYVAYMQLVNGFEHAVYWTADEVMEHANQFSQAYRAKKMDSPWFTNPESMCLKTVIKDLLSHWGPLSIQMQMAVKADQGVIDISGEVEYPDNNKVEVVPARIPESTTQPARRRGSPTPHNPAAEAKPEPAAEPSPPPNPPQVSPDDKLAQLRMLMDKAGVDEARVMQAGRELGVIEESLTGLEEVSTVSPSSLTALINGWNTLTRRFRQTETVQTPTT